MRTSRSTLDRLLDPQNASVTLQTLERAAQALGKRLRVEFAVLGTWSVPTTIQLGSRIRSQELEFDTEDREPEGSMRYIPLLRFVVVGALVLLATPALAQQDSSPEQSRRFRSSDTAAGRARSFYVGCAS